MGIRNRIRGGSIRLIILLGVAGMIFCIAGLAAAFVKGTNDLQAMMDDSLINAADLDTGEQLQNALIDERYEDSLILTSRNPIHDKRRRALMLEAESLTARLHVHPVTRDEQLLVDRIKKLFASFKEAELKNKADDEQTNLMAEDLLRAVADYKTRNISQMDQSRREAQALNADVERWTLALVIIVVTFVPLGAFVLINRIIQPTLSLMETSKRFGRGDFSARTRVHRDDELGRVCGTFNEMAGDINRLEQERLNFVASVVHDLKNPLVVIGAAAQLLRKKNACDEKYAVWLDRILKQTVFLENLISDLMDSVQIETGKLSLHLERFDLSALARETTRAQAELIATHKITFSGGHACIVDGDPARIERVILNLVSNAVKYSPENTAVTVSVERRAPEAALCIKDEGVGMGKSEIECLFKPFARLDSAMAMAKGTGLGLFSALRIVESHGGRINIVSEPGRGTVVEILLPLAGD